MLAEEACLVEDLDPSACKEVLSKAQSQLSSAGDDKARAEAAIAVEVAEELVRASS